MEIRKGPHTRAVIHGGERASSKNLKQGLLCSGTNFMIFGECFIARGSLKWFYFFMSFGVILKKKAENGVFILN